ncbi:hypothetical protein [Terriglobus sp. RCC_193]|uniref:hypothetical protein n=1 Tax=Terriglobus sp. RCC_193 TaxID=3239218 RepID=UPI00352665A1
MTVLRPLIVLIMLAVAGAASYGQAKEEQRIFDAESSAVTKPVPVPPEMLKLLSMDKDVKEAVENQGVQGKVIPQEWFSASLVSTARPTEKMYLLVGNGPLVGAHVTTFWLAKNGRSGAGPSVLLKATADRLEIGKVDSSGYPKITIVRLTATSMSDAIYHFIAGKYVPLHATK